MSVPAALWPRALAAVAARTGLDFSDAQRPVLESGLVRARRACGARSLEEYVDRLAGAPEESPEWAALLPLVTIPETYFFRDAACFAALEQCVLPELIAARRRAGARRLTVWSAGCASGEEPYSLAIVLDRLLPDRADWSLSILGTDINRAALDAARRGLYRAWSLRETPATAIDRYFRPAGRETYALDPAIRRMVRFAPLNLAAAHSAPPGDPGDAAVILCRNVLMYFGAEARQGAVARLGAALAVDGWLGFGATEGSAEHTRPLVAVHLPGATFFRPAGARPLDLPLASTGPVAPYHAGPDAPVAPMVRARPTQGPVASASATRSNVGAGTRAGAAPLPPRPAPAVAVEAVAPAEPLALARWRADRGDLEEARRLCELALSTDRTAVEGHLLLATLAQAQGDAATALGALRRALYLEPDCAFAHFLLGGAFLCQGDARRAHGALDVAIRVLGALPADVVVPGSGGLSAGALLQDAREYLALAVSRGAARG